jgi:hypothetical protein
MLSGWVKLFRRILDSPVFTSLPAGDLKVFIACLTQANIRARQWYNGAGEEEIARGSFVTSQPKLAQTTRLSRKQVRGALDRLQKIGSIRAKERAKRYTVIEVVNFEIYQDGHETPGQDMGLPRANAGPTPGHNVRKREENKKNIAGDSAPAGGSVQGKSPRAKRPANPNVKLLVDYYFETFRECFKSPPPIGGKEGAAAKCLLANRSLEEAKWLVHEHLHRPPEFYERKRLYGLEHVLKAAPTLLARKADQEAWA